MTSALTSVRQDFGRIAEEVRKAASYLAVGQAVELVPDYTARWERSDSRFAMFYMRGGCHMAFAVTLAATLDDKSGGDRIAIPKLVRRLENPCLRSMIAAHRRVGVELVNSEADRVRKHFERLKAQPSYEALRKLRHDVIAHHNRVVDQHGATFGMVNRLMTGTLRLVDRMSVAINGERSDIADTVAYVKKTAGHFWLYGIDGYPWESVRNVASPVPVRQ